ncbi:MAG TPA: DNA-3-methyladenine glycosylase [Thermoflexales bacterium]|nr:DNA-3-methyladenine glycosylase [Thermoflexales bacterium]HQZ21140.1 DNA-3-methyladenine glycosylase [Thermoflexales bacterium]HRA00439.1 DNA-3-methyladenine glycosylase [Thermoflexales bacterium]
MNRDFFARDARLVARDLLGMSLVRVLPDGSVLSGRVVETEAYRENDAASHSFRRRTTRNMPMFGKPGLAYVYFTYGMHFCFDVTAEPEDHGAGVLIRALEPLEGVDVMRANRARGRSSALIKDRDLLRGPANLCKAFGIDRAFNYYDLLQDNSVLFFRADEAVPDERASASPRIGIRGDPAALAALWRWYVNDSPSVSGTK